MASFPPPSYNRDELMGKKEKGGRAWDMHDVDPCLPYAVRGCKQGIFWGALSCARRAGFGLGNLVAAEAGESRLVAGVNSSIALSRSLRSTAATAAVTSTATVTTTLSATTSTAASASASTTSGALRLDEARVEVNGLLDLALALALCLASGRGEVLLLLVLEGLGVGPLLVELAALVGLTDLETGVESGLLLSLLGEIFLVRDLLLGLLLGGGSLSGSVLSNGILLLVLSDSFTGLLVLKLSSTLVSTPGLGSLLVRATVFCQHVEQDQEIQSSIPVAAELGRVSVIALTGVSSATSYRLSAFVRHGQSPRATHHHGHEHRHRLGDHHEEPPQWIGSGFGCCQHHDPGKLFRVSILAIDSICGA